MYFIWSHTFLYYIHPLSPYYLPLAHGLLQTAMAVQGLERIRARVLELDLTGARIDLTDGSMDAQVRGLTITYQYTHPINTCRNTPQH